MNIRDICDRLTCLEKDLSSIDFCQKRVDGDLWVWRGVSVTPDRFAKKIILV